MTYINCSITQILVFNQSLMLVKPYMQFFCQGSRRKAKRLVPNLCEQMDGETKVGFTILDVG